ncbi:uroporphyrinogen decarboxylase family protein [Halarsenatibacter silvermanii]|uniref:Uroporphyrinogen decarboxylase n=1 Tax=Halarsenatibacter silvermanii TaxID=321763 RepID=A0A1G9RHJ4_9FIRM|nr:uroporphyrinogen decarboxylase family protein [Halarsenatibacter silvermanii]SDM22716.1 uroporphyrinogen decarboxylase [Halarsenatibacter silvermanii]
MEDLAGKLESAEKAEDLRSILRQRYGAPSEEMISPRTRVERALTHQQPDRVPFDFWAVPAIKKRLKKLLAADEIDEVYRLLGVDCRQARPAYVGPAPLKKEDGAYVDRWGTVRQQVKNSSGGIYEEYAAYPLNDFESPAAIKSWEGWPEIGHWDFSDLDQRIECLNEDTRYHIRLELGGIFELSWGLYGFADFLTDLVERPELPCAVMDKFTGLFCRIARRALEQAGDKIDLVYTYDDVGTQSNLLISKKMWREFLLPRHQKLNEVIKSYSKPIMYHSCGAIYPLISELKEKMGIDVLNPLQPRAEGMDMKKIKKNYGGSLSFHGGIDLQKTLPRGSPAEVREEARKRCQVLGRGGGYICAPAHHVQSDTPLGNIIALYTADREL